MGNKQPTYQQIVEECDKMEKQELLNEVYKTIVKIYENNVKSDYGEICKDDDCKVIFPYKNDEHILENIKKYLRLQSKATLCEIKRIFQNKKYIIIGQLEKQKYEFEKDLDGDEYVGISKEKFEKSGLNDDDYLLATKVKKAKKNSKSNSKVKNSRKSKSKIKLNSRKKNKNI